MTETILFYRVENDGGVGPYTYSNPSPELDLMAMNHAGSLKHPTPWTDGALAHLFESGQHVCGFTDEVRMREWFEGYESALAAEGFVVNVYEVDDDWVEDGRRQSIVDREALVDAVMTLSVRDF